MRIPLIILAIVLSILMFGVYIPELIQSFFYGLSLSIKNCLLFVLPLVIFSFIFNSIISLKSKAIGLLTLLVGLVCVSNFLSTWVAYFVYKTINPTFTIQANISYCQTCLKPLFVLHLEKIISNDVALISGIIIGLLSVYLLPQHSEKFGKKLVAGVTIFLNKIFVPIIPLFITGFIFKLTFDKQLIPLMKNYFYVFILIMLSVLCYLTILYGIVFKRKFFHALHNILAPSLIGFSSMSSAAALPVLSLSCEKNAQASDATPIIRAILPPITNFHLIGDCFAIPLIAFGILISMGYQVPNFFEYLVFTGYFVIYKFAVAAVPGGGILVMLPILQRFLNFSGEMLSLITMVYILLDPFITMTNVMGNGVFSIMFVRIYKAIFKDSC